VQAALQHGQQVVDGLQVPARALEDLREAQVVEPGLAVDGLDLAQRDAVDASGGGMGDSHALVRGRRILPRLR